MGHPRCWLCRRVKPWPPAKTLISWINSVNVPLLPYPPTTRDRGGGKNAVSEARVPCLRDHCRPSAVHLRLGRRPNSGAKVVLQPGVSRDRCQSVVRHDAAFATVLVGCGCNSGRRWVALSALGVLKKTAGYAFSRFLRRGSPKCWHCESSFTQPEVRSLSYSRSLARAA